MYEYRVSQRWCGWWGGLGSSDATMRHIEQNTVGNWRLVRTESAVRFWLFFVPRVRVMFIYERASG